MKIMLPSKLDTCKKFLLIECWVDKKIASLTETEAGLMQGILARYVLN